jgi:hypothetical protein
MARMSEPHAEPAGFNWNSLHDAELRSVAFDKTERTATLVFRKVDEGMVRLAFKDVLTIKVSGMFLRNAVSRAQLSSVGDLAVEEVRRITTWAFSDDGESLLVERAALENHISNVADRSRFSTR